MQAGRATVIAATLIAAVLGLAPGRSGGRTTALAPGREARAADPLPTAEAPAGRVYGEWRIRVRPDKGAQYNQLIAEKGLPLFREAGGRMVGWWTTLIGDLYEHVTIWEYDRMASFDKAVAFLGKDERFAKFVALRDPLLVGEESRFLRPVPAGAPPSLPEAAGFVIHEVHRVPLARQQAYFEFMREGLSILKKHKFRPVGPWRVDVGRWTEVTYLFLFASLSEREERIAAFSADPEGREFVERIQQLADEVSSRGLTPAPFAR